MWTMCIIHAWYMWVLSEFFTKCVGFGDRALDYPQIVAFVVSNALADTNAISIFLKWFI